MFEVLLPHSRKTATGVTTRGVVAVVGAFAVSLHICYGRPSGRCLAWLVYGPCCGNLSGRRLCWLVGELCSRGFCSSRRHRCGFSKTNPDRASSTGSSSRWRRRRVLPTAMAQAFPPFPPPCCWSRNFAVVHSHTWRYCVLSHVTVSPR